jgi:Kdo2-lipid IVA lauroyltransferase/acyltransferase
MDWKPLRHRAEYLAFLCVVAVCDALPSRVTHALAHGLAMVVHYVLPARLSRYPVARENLIRAFGDQWTEADRRRTVYRMWVHLFRMVVEIIQSPRKLHLYSYRRIVEFADFQPCVEAMTSGRRVLLLGGHFGNWEMGIAIFGLWGFPMGVVARELDNPYLNDWFQRYRESTGHRMLAKSGGYDEMLELLKRGGNLALLCDQDAGPRGVYVDFFGTPASTFKSLALLSLEYDALIVVGYAIRKPTEDVSWTRYETGCEAVIDPRQYTGSNAVREITESYTQALERAIRRAPEQYFWVHRRWKSQPRPRKGAATDNGDGAAKMVG